MGARSNIGTSLLLLLPVGGLTPGISGDILPVSPRDMPDTLLVPGTGYYVKTVWVFNNSGATIPANQVCRYADGSDINVLECATAELTAEKIAGIAPQAIPDQYYGRVVRGGKFAVLNDSGAAITAGDRLKTTNSGGVATNDESTAARVAGRCGIALETIANGATGIVDIDLP
jgi:hypothetical protein